MKEKEREGRERNGKGMKGKGNGGGKGKRAQQTWERRVDGLAHSTTHAPATVWVRSSRACVRKCTNVYA